MANPTKNNKSQHCFVSAIKSLRSRIYPIGDKLVGLGFPKSNLMRKICGCVYHGGRPKRLAEQHEDDTCTRDAVGMESKNVRCT